MKRVALLPFVVMACADPVQSAEQTSLGPEDPSVPRGELHRPGQPCLVCHSDFAFAGTVYQEDFVTPFEGATVNLLDTAGDQLQANTNSAGNFIIRKSDLPPTFTYPVGTYADDAGNAVFGITVVGSDPNNPAQMVTQIGREGSCNACHTPAASVSSPGPIYVTTGTP
jgi:hypothetical protein